MGNGSSGGGGGNCGSNYGSHSTPGDHNSGSTSTRGSSSNILTGLTPVPAQSWSHTPSYGESWGQTNSSYQEPAREQARRCEVSQEMANTICDNCTDTQRSGYGAAIDNINGGVRCLEAQREADRACGK